jgi:hypothetical protein
MTAQGSFLLITLSSFALMGFSWVLDTLLTNTCLDGVHPKDASNEALGFGVILWKANNL